MGIKYKCLRTHFNKYSLGKVDLLIVDISLTFMPAFKKFMLRMILDRFFNTFIVDT